MIGLKRGAVAIVEHQAEWADIARETIVELKEIFGDIAVEIRHIGSTAIRGIKAKSIIDIAAGVRSLELPERMHAALVSAGWQQAVNRFSSDLLYVMQDADNVRTHQLHILIHGCEQWHNYVDFMDYMNAFPEKAKEYEALKQHLAENCDNVQIAYTDGKREYMLKMLAEAREWAKK